MRLLLILAALVAVTCFPLVARAADPPLHFAAGANGAWLDGPGAAFPADFEMGGTAWKSASPHLSAVGGLWYGFSHSYLRYNAGARVTSSDVSNPDFNTFLGVGYRGGSTTAVGPNEWEANAGFGLRVMPDRYPGLTVGGVVGHGLTSSRLMASLGLRFELTALEHLFQ